MQNKLGWGHVDFIQLIDDFDVQVVDNPLPLSERARSLANEAKKDIKFDGDALSLEYVVRQPEQGRVILGVSLGFQNPITEGNEAWRYSMNVAGRKIAEEKQAYHSDVRPTDYMYGRRGHLLIRKNADQVNPVTQGVYVLLDSSGDPSVRLDDLLMVFTKRGDVDHGQGLRHIVAGAYRRGTAGALYHPSPDTFRTAMQTQLQKEVAVFPEHLELGMRPFALVQDHNEPQLLWIAIVRKTREQFLKETGYAEDQAEASKFYFVPLREVPDFVAQGEQEGKLFYSHSRVALKDNFRELWGAFNRCRFKTYRDEKWVTRVVH